MLSEPKVLSAVLEATPLLQIVFISKDTITAQSISLKSMTAMVISKLTIHIKNAAWHRWSSFMGVLGDTCGSVFKGKLINWLSDQHYLFQILGYKKDT